MKKSYVYIAIAVVALVSVFVFTNENSLKEQQLLTEVKINHKKFILNSPFKEGMSLSKAERKAIGIPPNKYLEREWELTMNPYLGRPTSENIQEIQKNLAEARALGRVPGDAMDNLWIERGPNNVGGRTRALLFDPNDTTGETVFAGSMGGGLWKNTNISSSTSSWSQVDLPENVNVSCIVADPITSTTFYLGTGESYTGGDSTGNGVWKSTNSGGNWTQIFGGITGPTTFVAASVITVNNPAGIAGDYACFPSTAFGPEITSQITADFVLANDGSANPTEGCNGFTAGSMTGKIAVIRRGNCTFVIKVKAAQDAGAIGVIVMNHINGTPVAMGGTDTSITIPSVMISKAYGDLLETALNNGTVNGSLNIATGDFTGNLVPGIQHINDIVIRNNNNVSEIYVAAADGFYAKSNATTYIGGPEFGLYKSTDGGTAWTELMTTNLTADGHKHCPNDLEIGADNRVWMSTKNSRLYGDGGGKIFASTNTGATAFTLKHTITDGRRTQIAVSKTVANKVYVLAQGNTAAPIKMVKTSNDFGTTQNMGLPNDSDAGVPANDFTRGQAFFDLVIAIDPTNDNKLFVGGINLFKSANGGGSWSKFSDWHTVPFGKQIVHSDQHAIVFGPGNKMLFGNDGGVYYSGNSGTTTTARIKDYNVTQFYSVGVAPSNTTESFAAGAQDNGTQQFHNKGAGVRDSYKSQGGDGGSTDYNQVAGNYYISNYVYNQSINQRGLTGNYMKGLDNDSSSDRNGDFINQQGLDSNLNILYTNYTTRPSGGTPTYQIRRYKIQAFGVNRFNMTDPLLTSGGAPVAFKVSPFTTNTTKLLVGTVFGDLLQVNNANVNAASWSSIGDSNFVGSISDIEYGATENDIFVTMHNYGVENIWYTSNGGTTWAAKEGNLPDMPVKCILQNPLDTNQVIVGTELGVWYTGNFSDASPSWASAFNGMSNVKVTDLDLRAAGNKVFAATYGRGVFSGVFDADASLTVQDNEFEGLSVYPNPTSGVVNIKSSNNLNDVKISVHDISGKLISTLNKTQISTNQIKVNISNLSTGSYFITIENDTYKSTKQIIKK